jgi:hypothetical protein
MPNTSFERTREGKSANCLRRRARRSTQPLGVMSRTSLVFGALACLALSVLGCSQEPDRALYNASAKDKGLPFDMTVSELRRTATKSYLEIPGFNARTSQQARWSMCVFTDLAMKRGFDFWTVVYPPEHSSQTTLVVAFSNSENASPAELLGPDFVADLTLGDRVASVEVFENFCTSVGYL